jgi:hypothetical protein
LKARIHQDEKQGHVSYLPDLYGLLPGESTNSPGCKTWVCHHAAWLKVNTLNKKARIQQDEKHGHATYLPEPFNITPWRNHEFTRLQNMGMPPRCLALSENSQ